jgi:aminopeptidase N
MCKPETIAAILVTLLAVIAIGAGPAPSSADNQLAERVRSFHDRLIQDRIRAVEKQRALETRYANEMVSNWAEYDITYYDLYLIPDFENQGISGEVGVYGRPTVSFLDSVMLNLLDDLTVDSVYGDAGILSYRHDSDHVTIYLDHAYSLGELFGFTVAYHGNPWGDPAYPGLSFYSHNGSPTVASLSEPFMSRAWWPCNDIPEDKADSVDVHITVSDGLEAVSNGLLASDVDNGNGTHTLHWRHRYPISTYLVCFAVADYVSWQENYAGDSRDSMPVINYVFPDQVNLSHSDLSYTLSAMGIFADRFGEYPFIAEKYGHTQVQNYVGMENQTNTFLILGTSYPEQLVVHELAHQWWGDMVTCRDWHHIWLNEGFATYCEALYFEALYGSDYYRNYMIAMDNFADGSVYVEDTITETDIFNYRVYAKGAWVLHMLRYVVGDSVFFAILHAYREAYAYGTATTEDFQSICESVSGQDLTAFFQQWIYGIGRPYYRHAYYTEPSDSGGFDTYIAIRQDQETGPPVFVMPIDIKLRTTGDTASFTLFNDQQEQNYVVHTDSEVLSMYLDPDHWMLRDELWEQYRLRILTDSLSDGVQYEPYEDTIVVKGVYPGHDMVCEVISGELPPGWTLESSTGIISGENHKAGAFTFMVRATDEIYSESYRDSAEYTVDIVPGVEYPGDANADGDVNIGDAVYLVNYIFKGGPPPPIPNWADADADCAINIADAVYLINFIFKSGPEPQMGCVE